MRRDASTELLKRARRRITDPQRWTQGAEAREAGGCPTAVWHPEAVRWCAIGALAAECCTARLTAGGRWHVQLDSDRFHLARQRLEAANQGAEVPTLNDHQGHGAVLALYDAAIREK